MKIVRAHRLQLWHDTSNISDIFLLESSVQTIAHTMESLWAQYLKTVDITKHSKNWWDLNCNRDLEKYRFSKHIEDWKQFRNMVKKTKQMFFDQKIQEIANKSCGSWTLMTWVIKWKLPAIEVIKYNNQPCLEIKDLWQALHFTFNRVQNWQINVSLLNELLNKHSSVWLSFSKVEFINAISKCNNSSTPGPDKLLWKYLKTIVNDSRYLKKFIDIVDACVELGY